jgi:hypothetical protein
MSDQEIVRQHRTIWAARPELRAVYQDWFAQLLCWVKGLHPIVEIGAGPGFFQERSSVAERYHSFTQAVSSHEVAHLLLEQPDETPDPVSARCSESG